MKFRSDLSSGQLAVGHGGGNIGTTTYKVYLPETQVSVVVMINAFPNKAAESITKGLINTILRDLDALEIFPLLDANKRYIFIAICVILIWAGAIRVIIRSKRKR